MKPESKPTRPIYCGVGHEMETRIEVTGTFAKCTCHTCFVHISVLLREKKAFWSIPQEVAANLAVSKAQPV